MQNSPSKGFTLIEVTLMIVVCVVIISGATLLYRQAEMAARNNEIQVVLLNAAGEAVQTYTNVEYLDEREPGRVTFNYNHEEITISGPYLVRRTYSRRR